MTARVLVGDCLDLMPTFEQGSVDAIVTDPPYGLAFMGKAWDHGVPGKDFWSAATRCAKPGAHLVAFGGTRTYHRLTCAIEDAGWEIRDCLSWLYGSGFPKSHNGPWGGTALKPAWEPIILARMPLAGTVAVNVAAYRTGALNIDGCRINWASNGEAEEVNARCSPNSRAKGRAQGRAIGPAGGDVNVNPVGRWPANVVLDEDAAAKLDEQSGSDCGASIGNGITEQTYRRENKIFGQDHREAQVFGYDARGGASRFFYTAKASRAEREAMEYGPELREAGSLNMRTDAHAHRTGNATAQRGNHHPTVKPLDLMRWLVRLVTPPNGLILDPFAGSGTTGCAALAEGFRFIGIEREPEYVAIAKARLNATQPALGLGA